MSSACPIFGFEFWFRLDPAVDEPTATAVLDGFIAEVERHGLLVGGGGEIEWRYVVTRGAGQATEADRQLLLAWAAAEPRIREAAAGALIDVNEG